MGARQRAEAVVNIFDGRVSARRNSGEYFRGARVSAPERCEYLRWVRVRAPRQ
jgi:hypothetical protein